MKFKILKPKLYEKYKDMVIDAWGRKCEYSIDVQNNFTKDISAIKSNLEKIGFDSESELVTITQNTIANILNRVVDK